MTNQVVGTPWEFIHAVESRFGNLAIDLAADAENAKADVWYGPDGFAEDSLSVDWHVSNGLMWLNPPFSDIAPWAKKCAEESRMGARILLLIPASVGSNWYAGYVFPHASVHALRPRLTFEGHKDPYPKDLILAYFNKDIRPGFDCWKWR